MSLYRDPGTGKREHQTVYDDTRVHCLDCPWEMVFATTATNPFLAAKKHSANYRTANPVPSSTEGESA